MILWRNIEIFHFFLILIPIPDFPHFYYMLGGNLGSLLYGDVSVMTFLAWSSAQLVESQGLDCKVTGSNLEQDREL